MTVKTMFSEGIPERHERKNHDETFIYPEELMDKRAAAVSGANQETIMPREEPRQADGIAI